MIEPTMGQLWLVRTECDLLCSATNRASGLIEGSKGRQPHLSAARERLERIAELLGYEIIKKEVENA